MMTETKRPTLTCIKCDRTFRRPTTTGRPPSYCSTGCRRAREFELRRLQSALQRADGELRELRQAVADVRGYRTPNAEAQLAWWTAEHERLEDRLRVLLDDDDG